MKTIKKILPPTLFLAYVIGAWILHYVFPIKSIIPVPYTYLGIPLIILGIGVNVWVDRLFKINKTTVKPFEQPSFLITKGPFRLSQHPMYLGFVSILLGEAIFLGSLITFIAPILMFITFEKYFIPYEERNLQKIFGKKYQDYKKQIRKWI